jgi:hypothetical protein
LLLLLRGDLGLRRGGGREGDEVVVVVVHVLVVHLVRVDVVVRMVVRVVRVGEDVVDVVVVVDLVEAVLERRVDDVVVGPRGGGERVSAGKDLGHVHDDVVVGGGRGHVAEVLLVFGDLLEVYLE